MPASNTWAMLGWSIRASAWRSDSNRARTLRESMPGLISLRATRRRTGRSCSARKTTPIPPSPICWSSLYGPIRVPGPSVSGREAGYSPENELGPRSSVFSSIRALTFQPPRRARSRLRRSSRAARTPALGRGVQGSSRTVVDQEESLDLAAEVDVARTIGRARPHARRASQPRWLAGKSR